MALRLPTSAEELKTFTALAF
ncbi:hypothetical protein AVEN_107597-1, partial [Araneus ventricosus]